MSLTNAEVLSLVSRSESMSNLNQAQYAVPMQVDLSAGDTLGRAITLAVDADANLKAAVLGRDDEGLLRSITAIKFVSPVSDINILAYSASSTHKYAIPAGADYCEPAVQIWRQHMAGPSTQKIAVYLTA